VHAVRDAKDNAFTVVQGCITHWPGNAGTQILTPKISVTTEPILIKLETKNYHPKASHHAKLHLDVMTWVVSLPLFELFDFLFFSPLGKVAGRAIYFTDVFSIFFLFFIFFLMVDFLALVAQTLMEQSSPKFQDW